MPGLEPVSIMIKDSMELRLEVDPNRVRGCYESFVMRYFDQMSDDGAVFEVLDAMRSRYKMMGRKDCVSVVEDILKDILEIESNDNSWQRLKGKLGGKKSVRNSRPKVELESNAHPRFGLTGRFTPESVDRMEEALCRALRGKHGIADGFVEGVFSVLRGRRTDLVIKGKCDNPKMLVRLIVDELVKEEKVYGAEGELNNAVLQSFLRNHDECYARDAFSDASRTTAEAQEISKAIKEAERLLQGDN